jgi:hypothetical protein
MYEIRMPNLSAYWEKDSLAIADSIGIANTATATSEHVDRDAHFGRVGYIHGGAIDRPIIVMRMDYADHAMGAPAFYNPKPYCRFQSFALYPQWDVRGEPALGSVADGGLWQCEGTGAAQRCTNLIAWSAFWSVFGARPDLLSRAWAGSLVQDKREANGLLYRRNRYLD